MLRAHLSASKLNVLELELEVGIGIGSWNWKSRRSCDPSRLRGRDAHIGDAVARPQKTYLLQSKTHSNY